MDTSDHVRQNLQIVDWKEDTQTTGIDRRRSIAPYNIIYIPIARWSNEVKAPKKRDISYRNGETFVLFILSI